MRIRRPILSALGVLAVVAAGSIPATASADNTEYFLVVQTTDSGSNPPVSGTGPIHAAGKDFVLSNNRDRFAFPKGDVTITHHRTSGRQSFDPANCTGRFTEAGTYQVVSGTGAYSHAAGHGTYNVTAFIIGCD